MSDAAKHAWIIGASQGMGLALAELMTTHGWQVTMSARSAQSLDQAAASCGGSPLAFDATQHAQMQAAANQVFQQRPPSVIVMNVGDYQPMPASEFSVELFESLTLSNYLSSVYLLEAVIPHLRQVGGGQILLNASAAAYRGLPNSAPYSAPKAALLHLAEAMAPELRRDKIRLRVINPGFVQSRLTDKNRFKMPFLMSPQQAAQRIYRGIFESGFEIAFPRRLTWTLKLLRCLPYRWYFSIVERWVLR